MDKSSQQTDFSDPKLFSVAKEVYQTEFVLSQHYETLRATLTGVNLALVGAFLTLHNQNEPSHLLFLAVLGIVSALLALRLGQAHKFHFKLAAKMRRIALQHHAKTFAKFSEVNKEWTETNFWWQWADHEALWVLINLCVPWILAAVVYYQA